MFGRSMIATAVALAMLGATAVATARAQTAANCRDRDSIVEVLSKRYNETRRGFGLSSPMQMLELFASEKGTWTALITTPDGRSCIVASGDAWTEVKPLPGEAVAHSH
jgi:hypothetical protein